MRIDLRRGIHQGEFDFNPFLFIKNKRLFISSEGFSTLEKNAMICYQRAMLPIQSGVTASADNNGSLAPFLFEFKLSG
jgi:hypothetical protein